MKVDAAQNDENDEKTSVARSNMKLDWTTTGSVAVSLCEKGEGTPVSA